MSSQTQRRAPERFDDTAFRRQVAHAREKMYEADGGKNPVGGILVALDRAFILIGELRERIAELQCEALQGEAGLPSQAGQPGSPREQPYEPTRSQRLVAQYLHALGIPNPSAPEGFRAMTAVLGRQVSAEAPVTPEEAKAAGPALQRTLKMAEKDVDWLDFFAFVRSQQMVLVERAEMESAYRARQRAKRNQDGGDPKRGGAR